MICLVLVLGTAALYAPAVGFKFADSDDRDYVIENYRINSGWSLSGLVWCFQIGYAADWKPVTWMSHMLDCQLYGLNPGGHHLTNIVLHVLNSMLLFLILQCMTGATWQSAMVAAFFAWHPLRVESVAWIAERKDVLSTFFWLLTLGAYVRYVELRKAQRPNGKVYYLTALLFFSLAIMAKSMVVTLPCVLLLLDWWPLRRWQGGGGKETAQLGLARLQLFLEKIPFFTLSALCCLMSIMAEDRGGAIASLKQVSLDFRLYNAVISYWRYIGKLLVPINLSALYPILPGHRSALLAAAAGFALLALSDAAIRLRYKRPYFFVGWFWYLGTLVPVIGLIHIGAHLMADRYTYVPSLGLFIPLCWAAIEWSGEWKRRRLVLAFVAAMTLGASVCLTARQLQYWRNGETLWTHAIAVTKDNYLAHENYAEYLVEHHRWDEARSECRLALDYAPGFGSPHLWLGIILYHERKFDEAKREITLILNDRWDGELGEQYLGSIALEQNRPAEALAAFTKELASNPAIPAGHCGLAQALARQGKLAQSREEFKAALRLRPDYPEALHGLAGIQQAAP